MAKQNLGKRDESNESIFLSDDNLEQNDGKREQKRKLNRGSHSNPAAEASKLNRTKTEG